MSFAISFTVTSNKSYPTRKRVHLIDNTGGNISTVERSYLNQAIYDLYKNVNKTIDKTYYGLVNLTRTATEPYTVTVTEDRRIANIFNPELNEL